jgi:hypothetical protein
MSVKHVEAKLLKPRETQGKADMKSCKIISHLEET